MTPYSDIYKRFSSKLKDKHLKNLFVESIDKWENYIFQYLENAIDNFYLCKHDLYKKNDEEKYFEADLNGIEKQILCDLMVVEWMTKTVNDVEEMRLHFSNTDFKTYAESNNLLAKKGLRNEMKENVNNLIVNYTYM